MAHTSNLSIPLAGNLPDRVLRIVYESSVITREELIDLFPDVKPYKICEIIERYNLEANGHHLDLPNYLKKYYDDSQSAQNPKKAQSIVAPPYHPPFRPLSSKYHLSAIANRNDAGDYHSVNYHYTDVAVEPKIRGCAL